MLEYKTVVQWGPYQAFVPGAEEEPFSSQSLADICNRFAAEGWEPVPQFRVHTPAPNCAPNLWRTEYLLVRTKP